MFKDASNDWDPGLIEKKFAINKSVDIKQLNDKTSTNALRRNLLTVFCR